MKKKILWVEMREIMNTDEMKIEIEKWFQNYFIDKGSYNRKLYDSMYYSISAGGKRIRPLLMLLTYSIYNKNYKNIISIACSMEMIHTYSLIHDDLPCMDDDDLRRGRLTNHKKFGENIAVLAGDALLNEAFIVMFDYCSKNLSKESIEACNVISKAAGSYGMIGGQVVDVLSECSTITEEKLLYMHNKKTGALIKASIIAGAILGGAPSKEIDCLMEFGDALGLAFQIKDDILDVEGDTQKLGKKVNVDKDKNKATFISFYGIEKCKTTCNELTSSCFKILDNLDGDTSILKQLTQYLLSRQN